MSAYKIAIELTTQTIGKRARYYRNLIVAVVLISLSCFGCALLTWSVTPLFGSLLLFPVCGLFFLIDAKLLDGWRTQLFQSWIKKEIDFSGLRDALNAISALPKETLQGMLETLPFASDIIAEQSISVSTREAVASSIAATYINRTDAIAFRVAGFVIVAGVFIFAIALSIGQPLLLIGAATALTLLQKWTKQWRLKQLNKKVLVTQKQVDFNQEMYTQLVNRHK